MMQILNWIFEPTKYLEMHGAQQGDAANLQHGTLQTLRNVDDDIPIITSDDSALDEAILAAPKKREM